MKKLLFLITTVCLAGFIQTASAQTHWSAYNDFYFDSTNYANNSPSAPIPFPTTPSAAGKAWGYYVANCNGYDFPTTLGSYITPSSLYAMANYKPYLPGPGAAQVGGGVAGSQDAWDATGGSGLARYGGPTGLGSPFLGEYGGAWYDGAPGWGNAHASDGGLYFEPRWLGNPAAEGIPCVVTWTAPSDGTYTFNGSFLVASNAGWSGWSSSYAIVDSQGGVEVPTTVAALGSYNTFSFQKTLKARDVIQFQVGSGTNTAAPVGFNCDIELIHITDWDAFNDFYFATTSYANNSPGTYPPFPSAPSETGKAWGYYVANVNGYDFPSNMGSYFGPGTDVSKGQALYAMSSYQPLGAGHGQVAGGYSPYGATFDAWDQIGGDGLARYGGVAAIGTPLVGEYAYAWYGNAPGYGTSHAADKGLYLEPRWLGNPNAEGIPCVIAWIAPADDTYVFTGSFLNNSNTAFSTTYAIVDSKGGVEMPVTVAARDSYTSFSFTKTLKAQDVIQFQVGGATNYPSPVGFNCKVQLADNSPKQPLLVSASRPSSNPGQVTVKFNTAVTAATANNPANYSINNGVTVTAAKRSSSDYKTVVLTVSPGVNYPSVLTVNNVASEYGNVPVAANATVNVSVPVYLPSGFGVPTSGAQDTFSGSSLDSKWQSGTVNYNPTPANSNYFFSQVFTVSGGALHCRASTNTAATGGDLNYLIYVDPAYQSATTEEVLMHFKILASSFSSFSLAGAGVCMDANPLFSSPPGAACLRTVPSGYAGLTNDYPFFLACSDFIADNTVSPYGLAWQAGGSYWLRIRQDDAEGGGIIKTKVWLGDGSQPEPASWQSVWQDPGLVTRMGYAGIRAGYSGAVMEFDVDYFLVTAAGLPTITPKLPASLMPAIDLGIAINGANAVVSWPLAVGSHYKLQSTGALVSGWTNVTTSVVVSGDRNTVTVPRSGAQQFFRLSQ